MTSHRTRSRRPFSFPACPIVLLILLQPGMAPAQTGDAENEISTTSTKCNSTRKKIATLTTLPCTTALLDHHGRLVIVLEKVVDLKLLDSTLNSLLQSGMTLKTRFEVKSGTYLLRTVVRDSVTGRTSSLSSTVAIPG